MSALRLDDAPAIAAYQALELSANQTRRDALEKEVKTLAEEGAALRGQLDALTQQLQRDESEAQSLLQEEQALTEEWQTLCATLGVQLQPQEDLAGWLTAAEEHEQQLISSASVMLYKRKSRRILNR